MSHTPPEELSDYDSPFGGETGARARPGGRAAFGEDPAGAMFAADGQVGGMPVPASPTKGGVISKVGKGTMLLFAALVLGVVTVAVLSMRPGPQSVEADQRVMRQVDEAIAAYRQDPHSARQKNKELFKDTDAIAKAFYEFADKTQVPTDDLKQNPFVHRAAESGDRDANAEARALAERQRREEEARRVTEQRRKQMEAALNRLTIQTILYDPENPMVLIGNNVYRTGQTIGEFTIRKINRNSVVLQNGDETFVKNME